MLVLVRLWHTLVQRSLRSRETIGTDFRVMRRRRSHYDARAARGVALESP